jgi:hypothetical protein
MKRRQIFVTVLLLLAIVALSFLTVRQRGGGRVSLPSHHKVKFLGCAYRDESPLPNFG